MGARCHLRGGQRSSDAAALSSAVCRIRDARRGPRYLARMKRAVVSAVAAAVFVLAGCSGGGSASPYGDAPACPLLAQLARTGETVAQADVSDPEAFDSTLRAAVTQYVSTATELRAAVPER